MSEMAQTADHLIVIGRGKLLADVSTKEFISQNSTGSVRVRSPQADELERLLTAEGVTIERVDGSLRLDGITTDRVGDLAAASQLTLHELFEEQASLEEAFMEMTRDRVEFHAGVHGTRGGRPMSHADQRPPPPRPAAPFERRQRDRPRPRAPLGVDQDLVGPVDLVDACSSLVVVTIGFSTLFCVGRRSNLDRDFRRPTGPRSTRPTLSLAGLSFGQLAIVGAGCAGHQRGVLHRRHQDDADRRAAPAAGAVGEGPRLRRHRLRCRGRHDVRRPSWLG